MLVIRKATNKELTVAQRSYIYGLFVGGLTRRSISAQTGLPQRTINSTIQKITTNIANGLENPCESKPRSGRPSKLDSRSTRRLIRHTVAERTDSLSALATPSKSGQKLCRTTVRKVLKSHNKRRCRARKKPYVRPANKVKRLTFRRRNKHTPWGLVCWSDEAYFEVGEDLRSIYVTRTPDEEFLPECLQPTFKSGRTKVGVWGCFCGPHKGPIVILPQGTRLNRDEYTDQIFIPYFLPFYQKMVSMYGSGVQLQEDGASYHHNGFLGHLKKLAGIRILEWPPQSPDLSPIENLWHWMKLRISARRHRIKNIKQMAAAIREAWAAIPADFLVKLVNSMGKRMDLLRVARGGPIKY